MLWNRGNSVSVSSATVCRSNKQPPHLSAFQTGIYSIGYTTTSGQLLPCTGTPADTAACPCHLTGHLAEVKGDTVTVHYLLKLHASKVTESTPAHSEQSQSQAKLEANVAGSVTLPERPQTS